MLPSSMTSSELGAGLDRLEYLSAEARRLYAQALAWLGEGGGYERYRREAAELLGEAAEPRQKT